MLESQRELNSDNPEKSRKSRDKYFSSGKIDIRKNNLNHREHKITKTQAILPKKVLRYNFNLKQNCLLKPHDDFCYVSPQNIPAISIQKTGQTQAELCNFKSLYKLPSEMPLSFDSNKIYSLTEKNIHFVNRRCYCKSFLAKKRSFGLHNNLFTCWLNFTCYRVMRFVGASTSFL